jgi:hypothetical protein
MELTVDICLTYFGERNALNGIALCSLLLAFSMMFPSILDALIESLSELRRNRRLARTANRELRDDIAQEAQIHDHAPGRQEGEGERHGGNSFVKRN